MNRPLQVIDGNDWRGVAEAVRRRFDDGGTAVLLRADVRDAAPPDNIPSTVAEGAAVVIETSGSTGYPKRVVLSETALRASADATAEALGGPGQWLLCLPALYVAGLQVLVRSHAAALPPVVIDAGGFTAQAFVEASEQMTGGRRYTAVVPSQLSRLVEAGEASASARDAIARFDALLVGGQAMPQALADRATALGYTVVRSYGSSETAAGCVYDGYPVRGTQVRLRDGLLEIAGPSLADGYLGDPELTARTFLLEHGERWYRTGDRATIHDDGRIEVLGRSDNVIVSGGINVSLDRVEAAVREFNGFADAVVVAAPSAKWGAVPVIVVAGAAGDQSAGDAAAIEVLASIRRRLSEVIGVAAQADRIVVVAELPRLPSGKPDRRAITELVASAA